MILCILFLLICQSYCIHNNNRIILTYIHPKSLNVTNSYKKFNLNDISDGFNYYDDQSNPYLDQSVNVGRTYVPRGRYVNNVTLLGNVGTELKIFDYPTGRSSASFSLATVDFWKDYRTDELKSKTYWHKVSVFSQTTIRYLKEHLNIGDRVYVSGKLKYYLASPPELGDKKYRMNYISVTGSIGTVIIVSKKRNLRDNDYSGLYDRIDKDNNNSINMEDLEGINGFNGMDEDIEGMNMEEGMDEENINMDDMPIE